MAIVCHQHASSGPRFIKQRQQSLKISGSRSLANHHVLTFGNAFQCFVDIAAFMVIADSGSDVLIQLPAAEQRCVAIHKLSKAVCL